MHNLERFVDAQEPVYESVVQQLQRGIKHGHWMWYIFPQIVGLGLSQTSQKYAIKSIDEAIAYCDHPLLGRRLQECTKLVTSIEGKKVTDIFGCIDALKFRSCMTLFWFATGEELYLEALNLYFQGKPDKRTLDLLTDHTT